MGPAGHLWIKQVNCARGMGVATEQADRLLKNLLDTKILRVPSSQQSFLTMSIRIARLSSRQLYSDLQARINAADKALYFAEKTAEIR